MKITYNPPYQNVTDEYEPNLNPNPRGLRCLFMDDDYCDDYCAYKEENKCSLVNKIKK
ncbi:MAG: hypothetical protein AABY22_16130 [Nanoarchaeota archaeon]